MTVYCYSWKSVLCWLPQHSTANGEDDVRVCSDADSLETLSSAFVTVVNLSGENEGQQLCVCKSYAVKLWCKHLKDVW